MSARILLCAALVAGLLAVPAAAISGPEKNEDAVYPKATTICTPVNVANFSTRVHVRCSVAVSGILYFAVSTSNANNAARTLALFATALASGHDLRIYYDAANTSGTAIGCQAGDCRIADAVEML
jgi:hypothetical protein